MIRSVDTCIIARWLMRDDAVQTPIADRVMEGPIQISHTVLLELGWLMTSAGRMNREQFAATALSLLSLELAVIEGRDRLRWAVERFRDGADWSDMVHIAAVESAGKFSTFDKKLEQQAGPGAPVRVEVLKS